MDILFYSPDSQRETLCIEFLAGTGIRFNPIKWRSGMLPTAASVAIVQRPKEEMFDTQRKLRVVFNVGAGVDAIVKMKSLPDHVDIIRLEDSGMAKKMAEYVVHALADINRDMQRYRQSNIDKTWRPTPYVSFGDWPIGIMGLGVIGREIAASVARHGYIVNGWSRSPRKLQGIVCYAGKAEFAAFLTKSRVLINVLPLTDETENILNEATFSLLPPDSYVINIGRGGHLDETALIASIASGKVAGAVLDVFRTEPLPPNHPFWDIPAIRITPHISGTTDLRAAMTQIAQNIAAYQTGAPLTGIVDRKLGY